MKLKRVRTTYTLSPTGTTKGKVQEVKAFPASKPGRADTPDSFAYGPPPADGSANFDAWVDYYTRFIGARMEKLNAIQYEMDQANNKQKFETEFDNMAIELNPTMPRLLTWPLEGPHEFQPAAPTTPPPGGTNFFGKFRILASFEKDPDFEMVVNVGLQFEAQSGGAAGFSSSSFLATSSSSI